MKKQFYLIASVLLLGILATIVYAWAVDSDGGFAPYVPGICSDQYGNHSDYCLTHGQLVEYYPVTNGTGNETESYCGQATVQCKCNARVGYPAFCMEIVNFSK